jgi:hypothetical protein
MKLKMALAGVLVAGFVLPAVAQAQTKGGTYYVVRDAETKKCTITEKKPETTQTKVTVVNGVVYKTRTEAEDAIDAIPACATD